MTLSAPRVNAQAFDHTYQTYHDLLRLHVVGARVDYGKLKRNRTQLDAIVEVLGKVAQSEERGWSRAERLAFWINAYNVFTLRAIVDHYPIQGRWLGLGPRNSIRRIDGVWTRLRWKAAGREVTLDDIEHTILRKQLHEPRIHFAINCASVSCPPLADEPYRGPTLDAQLDAAARRYLASPLGLQVAGSTIRVSSIFKWYGGDFIGAFGPVGSASAPATDRAIFGVVVKYGPAEAARAAQSTGAHLAYLDYDWSLNDTAAVTQSTKDNNSSRERSTRDGGYGPLQGTRARACHGADHHVSTARRLR